MILEKKNEKSVPGGEKRGLEKHAECEKAQQFIITKTESLGQGEKGDAEEIPEDHARIRQSWKFNP